MTEKHHWSDWAGFSAFSFIWIGVIVTAPTIGLMTLPLVLHPMLSSAGFMLRRPPVKVIGGILPRVTSYGATFGVVAFFLFAGWWRPGWIVSSDNAGVRMAGMAVWFIGGVMDAYTVYYLRHGMSIEPQARVLLTKGPYALARHPLYAAYIVQAIGMCMRFSTIQVPIAFGTWLIVALLRIRYEERVLTAAFPEYADYRLRVGMFCPWPIRGRARRTASVEEPCPANSTAAD